MLKKIFPFLILFLLVLPSCSQFTAREAVLLMQRGINIGDTFDAPGGETAWGNPEVQEYYFDDFKSAGINAVRLPVTWTQHAGTTVPYTIDPTFLSRVEQVIDWAISRGIFLCLNAHHEGWLKNSNECVGTECGFTQGNQDRFNTIWQQIAEKLKDKSYYLIFEILNEPETMTTDHLNQIHSRVVQTIRSSGGNNAKRLIVFSGTLYSAAEQLVQVGIPEADHTYLIANYHTYCPWSFVSDLSGNARWGSQSDKDGVKAIFDEVKSWADQHDISIMFNEWGASFTKHEYLSEMEFYEYYVSSAMAYGFSAIVWDDGYDFTTYDRKNRTWHGDLIDVLTNPAVTAMGMKTVGYVAQSGVSRKLSSNGNYVGDIDSSDWMAYRIDIPQAGVYKLELSVSSGNGNGVINFRTQAGDVSYATIPVPNTGGDESWVTVSKEVALAKGLQNVALAANIGGFTVKWMRLSPGSQVNVTGVTISPKSFSVAMNNQYQLQGQVLPENASNTEVQWKSRNPSIAQVDYNGLVTGVELGSTEILVSAVDGGFTDSSQVTVIRVPVSGVALTPSSLALNVGKASTLTVELSPLNATDQTVSFTSSDSSVAIVDSKGVVTAIAVGTAKITAKTEEGEFSASSTVTINKPLCPEWQANINYPVGTVVEYQGQMYTSNNAWNSGAGDPYTATHSQTGWGWTIGGTCGGTLSMGFLGLFDKV